MFKWFKDCTTAEQGKKTYRQLSRKFHPDNGATGSVEIMQEINAEFELWWSRYKDIHKDSDGKTYESKTKTTETAKEFIDIVTSLSNLGVEIEICGSWLWITGDTFPVKDELKNLGCRWSKGKKQWYWTKDHYMKSRKCMSFDYIRTRYGSEVVETSNYKTGRLCGD